MTVPDEILADVVGLLEAQKTPYAVMGGWAARIHALPRPTSDREVALLLPRDDLPGFCRQLVDLGFAAPPTQSGFEVGSVSGMPVLKVQAPFEEQWVDVDFYLAETRFQRQLLDRREKHTAEGLTAWCVSPEDLILMKLVADRPKDRVEVNYILFVQGELNEDYLRRWAEELDVADALEKALRRRA